MHCAAKQMPKNSSTMAIPRPKAISVPRASDPGQHRAGGGRRPALGPDQVASTTTAASGGAIAMRVASSHAPDHLAGRICAAAACANGRRVVMEVVWAATSPDDGQFSPHEVVSTVEQLERRFLDLRARGEGYLEVRLQHQDFPLLTMGFRGDHAVIHAADSPESIRAASRRRRGAVRPHGRGTDLR